MTPFNDAFYSGGRSSGEFAQPSTFAVLSARSAFARVAAFSAPKGINAALSRISLANTPRRFFKDCVCLKRRRRLDMARSFPKPKEESGSAAGVVINDKHLEPRDDIQQTSHEGKSSVSSRKGCGLLSQSRRCGNSAPKIDGFTALRKASANGNKIRTLDAFRGCSSMVEQQPSKLNTRVRFPSPAPGCLLTRSSSW